MHLVFQWTNKWIIIHFYKSIIICDCSENVLWKPHNLVADEMYGLATNYFCVKGLIMLKRKMQWIAFRIYVT